MKKENNTKGIDSGIIRKIFHFTDQYRKWFIMAVAALIFSTAAELVLPVILQQSIDRNILSRWTWIDSDIPELKDVTAGHDYYRSKNQRVFILESDVKGISGIRRKELKDDHKTARESWYVFPESSISIENLKSLVTFEKLDHNMIAVTHAEMKSLDQDVYRSIRQNDIQMLKKRTLHYFLLLFVILVFTFFQIFSMSWTSQGVMKDIRITMLSHIIRQSLSFLGDTPVGSLVSRVTSDVETVNEFFTSVTISILKDFAIMGGVVFTLFYLDTRLALVTLMTLPPVLLSTLIFRKMAREAFRRQRHWISRVNSFLSEHVAGMEIIQIFGIENETGGQFKTDNDNLLKASMSEMYVFAVFRPLIDLFTSVTLGVVIYAGAFMLNRHILSLGVLIAFIDLIQKFYRPVMDMSEKFTIMQSAMAGGERIFKLLEKQNIVKDEGTFSPQTKIKGHIEFRNVNFSYRAGEPIIKNLSFEAKAGETVAIVGYTGAGKTTIASLATRLWDIDSGTILLDGVPLKKYTLSYLRKSIQSVQQDVFLFAGSVKENITLGSAIDDSSVRAAAQTVQADQFIELLDHKYETEIKERGKNLSGGQKQLLSFARAVAHNPSVLILDEATANVDTETEKLIQKALDNLLKDRTSLVIAHRISTIEKADRILVLSEGRLVESGRHEELIALGGLYYNLYNYQYASVEQGIT